MPTAWYQRLPRRQQAIYRASDGVDRVDLPDAAPLAARVPALRTALAAGDRAQVRAAAQALTDGIARALGVSRPRIAVLAVRPAQAGSELHGLYERAPGAPAVIRVWMRTARERRVVAFRTFLRTLLHELCHHLDYEHLRLADSLHTPGFFRRESSLFRQLVPEPQAPRAPSTPAPRSDPARAARELRQMRLVLGVESGPGKTPA